MSDDTHFDDYLPDQKAAEHYRRYKSATVKAILTLVIFILVLLAIVLFLAGSKGGGQEGQAEQAERQASATQAILPAVTDDERRELNQLRSDKAALLKKQGELERQVAALQQTQEHSQAQLDTQAQTIQAWQTDYKFLSDQYNTVAELYNDSEQYASQLEWERKVHLSIGFLASMPIARPEDGSATVFFGVGPSNWKLIAGVGYSLSGDVTVSAGFEYRFGSYKKKSVAMSETGSEGK